jgi:excisionase family DNA binding protein
MNAAEVVAATIRVPQAAKRMNVANSTVREWIASGRLPAVKVAGRLRVDPADLDRLAEPVTPNPRPAPPVPAKPDPGTPLLSVTQTAERLGAAPKTIREWLAAGRLTGQRVGKSWVVAESSIAAMERMRGVDRPHVREWR